MADLSMFLPKKIIDLLARIDSSNPSAMEEGTVVFCDVAGFTPLTEALSGIGKEGAEKLTGILNSYFAEMIAIVDNSGGDVIRFGGDAMTLYFPKGLEQNAAAASRAMMRKMDDFGEISAGGKIFSLAMKIGVAYGKVLFGVLGEEGREMDYYAAGAPLDDSAEAEHRASKGMVVFHPTFRNMCGGPVKEMGGGFAESLTNEENGFIHSPFKRQPVNTDSVRMAPLVPGYLVERAGEGTLGEHRGTAVIFLGIEGLSSVETDESAGKFHRDLNRFFHHLSATVRNYGGIINKVDMGDKGAKAIILFGSPYALENKEEMAVRCAVELRDGNPMKGEVRLRAGITSSTLFTGPVGSTVRREFTAMGDGINTAARLMQKAPPGVIFCDSNIAAATAGSVSLRKLEPLTLKGKENPVSVFSPEGFTRKDDILDIPAIIEREGELKKIKNLLVNRSAPMLIAGDAGCGKTVLIEWAKRESAALGMPSTRIFFAPYHRTRSYSLWKGVLRSIIGAKKEDGADRVSSLRDELLDRDTRNYGSLLNPLLGLEPEENPGIKSMSAKERKDLTFAIVEKMIIRGGERLILADNLEWADPLSIELLNFLLQGETDMPVKFIASCRTLSSDLQRIASRLDCVQIAPFSREGFRSHIRSNLMLEDASDGLLEWFWIKTGGNPKLAAAIFQILADRGILGRAGGKFVVDEDRIFSTPFPEKLEDIYLGKIDELPRDEREIVQIASVLGSSVSLFLLSLAADRNPGEVMNAADSLSEKGILRKDSWGERPYYRFADDLLRDAVYNALPFSLKREAHLRCALFLEKESGGKPGLYPAIAGHFKGAGDKEKANLYNRKSANDALGRFDNLTAMRFLEEICGEGISSDDVESVFNLIEVYGNLGRAGEELSLISKLEGYESGLEGARKLRLLSFKTKRSIMERDFHRAEKLFLVSEKLAADVGDDAALAKIYVNMAGGLYGPRGELEKAQSVLERCLSLRETRESAIFKVTALFNKANIVKHEGRDEEALTMYMRAYRKASRLKLYPQLANIAQCIASHQYSMGKFREALVWAKRAGRWAEMFGLRSLLLLNTHLTAALEHGLGKSASSLAKLAGNVEKARRFSNPYVQAISRQALIDVGMSILDVGSSLESGRSALDISKKIKASQTYKYTLVEVLKLFEAMEAPEEASRFIDETGCREFLGDSPPAPSVDPLLDTYVAWASASHVCFSCEARDLLSPDHRIDYLLFHAGRAINNEDESEAGTFLSEASAGISTYPSVTLKTKLFYYYLKAGAPAPSMLEKEVLSMLKKSPAGVFGLRALALLRASIKCSKTKNALRGVVISWLYRFRSASPEWAFSKLMTFPEIRGALRGEP